MTEEISESVPSYGVNYSIQPPENFNFQRPKDWVKWIKRFERFRSASGLIYKSQESQVNTLIYCLGPEAEDLLTSFNLTEAESNTYKIVYEKFNKLLSEKKNIIFERANFFNRVQKEDEPVEVFINNLYSLVDSCEFKELKEEMIRDRIVVGVRDSKLSEGLQRDPNLTLESAIIRVKQYESIKSQQPTVRKIEEKCIDNLNKRTTFKQRSENKQKGMKQNGCGKCGAKLYHHWSKCPANEVICNNCKRIGHFGKCCKTKKIYEMRKNRPEVEDEEDAESSEEAYLEEIIVEEVHSEGEDKPVYVNLKISNKIIRFKVDTGADVTVIDKTLFEKLNIKLKTTTKTLSACGRNNLKLLGYFNSKISYKDKQLEHKIYVIANKQRPLLSRYACKMLNLIQINIDELDLNLYNDLFKGLGELKYPYEIKLEENYKPYAVAVPRRVAISLRNKVKIELERMVKEGVITPIKEPTEWCAPIVVVPKPNGSVRLCVDYTELNKCVMRERFQLPSVDESLAQLSGANVFSVLDASSGFWQVPLSENCKKITTFIAPFGRYFFNRLPFGINSGPEHFQRRIKEILEGLEGVINHIDDILVWGKNQEEHDLRLKYVFRKLKKEGVTLNKSKCKIGVKSVKYLGHIIENGKVKPDPERIKAIINLPQPSNISELRRFLGMINYIMKFVPNLAEKTKNLRDLLNKNSEWIWAAPQIQCFENLKKEITQHPVLSLYDPNKLSRVSADASSFGIGAVLEQETNDVWKPVYFASRSLNETERRYAQIEKEALSITWACEKFKDYILGTNFKILTDHKPLVQILQSKPISSLSARLQRFRMRLSTFKYNVEHIPGKNFWTADTLSRAPLKDTFLNNKDVLEEELFINSVIQHMPYSDVLLEQVRIAQRQNAQCVRLEENIKNGFSDKNFYFWPYRGEMSVNKGLIMKGNRIYIPPSLRQEMLKRLHTGHVGLTKCRRRAQQSMWWPNLTNDIKKIVENCPICTEHRINHVEPLMPTELPKRPWILLGVDLMEFKAKKYLILIDYYSKFIEVAYLNKTTSWDIITKMKNIFSRYGIPEEIRSDNGPQFSSEDFKDFSKEYGFIHAKSSPKFPQSNGQVERAVKIVKDILKKNTDIFLGLLTYRATPLESGFSPAELLFGRKIRTLIPIIEKEMEPSWTKIQQNYRQKANLLKNKYKKNFDSRHKVKDLAKASPGELVFIPDLKRYGKILKETGLPRSYLIKTKQGDVRRNRRDFLVTNSNVKPIRNYCDSTSSFFNMFEDSPVDNRDEIRDVRDDANYENNTHIVSDVPDVPVGTFMTRCGRTVKPPERFHY